jgi:hypothetical protein
MCDGLWGLAGTVIGSILTMFTQWRVEKYHESKENIKILQAKYFIIKEDIFKLVTSIKKVQNFSKVNIATLTDEELAIYRKEVNSAAETCAEIWPEFQLTILIYFRQYPKYFDSLNDIINMIIDLKTGSIDPEYEILKNQYTEISNMADLFSSTDKLVYLLDQDYTVLSRKLFKKTI